MLSNLTDNGNLTQRKVPIWLYKLKSNQIFSTHWWIEADYQKTYIYFNAHLFEI